MKPWRLKRSLRKWGISGNEGGLSTKLEANKRHQREKEGSTKESEEELAKRQKEKSREQGIDGRRGKRKMKSLLYGMMIKRLVPDFTK